MSLMHLYIGKRDEITALLTARENARLLKDWELVDSLRKQLFTEYSIRVVDTSEGQQPSSYEELLRTTYSKDIHELQCSLGWCNGEIKRLNAHTTYITKIFEEREAFAYSRFIKPAQIMGAADAKNT